MSLMGLFFTKNRRALMGLSDAPYHLFGQHALCEYNCVSDGGAIACAVGRVRNAKELHTQLSRERMSASDPLSPSELVLSAYRMWGADYPRHLEGVVMTAVIDQDAGQLVVSRDRMGELPLFYAYRGSSVAFSDHPSVLLKSTLASSTVDRDGLCELFALGPARTPGWSPLRDIYALEAGCTLIANAHGHRVERYFSLNAQPHEDNEADTIAHVRFLVEQAMGDVLQLGPGSMLSGGLDSTVLTALLSKMTGVPPRTYSLDYEDNSDFFSDNPYQPERDAPYAEMAASLFDAKHTQVVLPIEVLFEGLNEAMELRGFPGMADIDSSLMLFARALAKQERHVLSGECADEVFGGYPWFRREDLIGADMFPWSGSLALRESVLKPSVRKRLMLARYAAAHYHESVAALPVLADEDLREAKLRQIHGLCFQWFMPNLQERALRMCEGSGLTVLTPFCDDRLVQYVYNVPWSMKTMNGMEKGLLRKAMADLLPDALLNRKKNPFPKTYHPLYSRLVRNATRSMLDDASSPILELIDADALRALAGGPLSPVETPWFGQLMAGPQMLAYLLQVNAWLRKYRVDIVV